MKMPSFFIVGAQKAGTTTLHDWLVMHPSVCLPAIKETHYFRDEDKYKQGVGWYLDWFEGAGEDSVLGEVDPEYMYFPEVVERMRKTVSQPKFVFIFRNIMERAYSHYQMSQRRGYEDQTFSEALRAEQSRLNSPDAFFSRIHHSYFSRGCYSSQVLRFIDSFPDAEFLFIKFDDLFLSDKGYSVYASVCRFISIDIPDIDQFATKRSNCASEPKFLFLRDLLYRESELKRVLGRMIPSEKIKLKIALMLDSVNQTKIKSKSNSWSDAVPSEFWESANNEINALEKLVKLDLSNWYRK
jgi:hypothetical protein